MHTHPDKQSEMQGENTARIWDMLHTEFILKIFALHAFTFVTLDHKTSHKCQFYEIEIYTSMERLFIQLSDDVWFVMIGQYL